MKAIKIFDEYSEIKKQMHKRPHYADVENAINNPYLFKAPNRAASKLLNSSYAQSLINPSGGGDGRISNDVKLGPDGGTFFTPIGSSGGSDDGDGRPPASPPRPAPPRPEPQPSPSPSSFYSMPPPSPPQPPQGGGDAVMIDISGGDNPSNEAQQASLNI
jgi:hypothetical protein